MKRFASLRPHLPPVLLFAALTLWVAWPVWLAPSTRLEPGDPELNSYILAWVQHALLRDPANFFHANMFYPMEKTLAYGEVMLTQALLALPARWLGGGPAALHNLSLLQGLFLSALAAYALGWHYFRSRAAATAAGLAYGFAAYRVGQMGHLQLIHGEFLPLMVLAFERLQLDDADARESALLLVFAALGQWLSSWYWAVFTFWALVPLMLGRWWLGRRALTRRKVLLPVAALAAAALLALPVAWPYVQLHKAGVMFRPAAAFAGFAATLLDFLHPIPRSLLWGGLARPDAETGSNVERYLFPGLAVAGGFLAALFLAFRRRQASSSFPAPLWIAVTLLLLSFSFGAASPAFRLAALIPGSEQMRVPARWMLPALLGVSLLVASLVPWLATLRFGRRAVPIFLALLAFESLTRPLHLQPVPERPGPLEQWLDALPEPAPTLFLPSNAPLLTLRTALHRQPTVNGSNGYFPFYYNRRMIQFARFPDADVVAALRVMRVRYVALDAPALGIPASSLSARLEATRGAMPDALGEIVTLADGALLVELLPPPDAIPFVVPDLGGVPGIGVDRLSPAEAAALDSFMAGR